MVIICDCIYIPTGNKHAHLILIFISLYYFLINIFKFECQHFTPHSPRDVWMWSFYSPQSPRCFSSYEGQAALYLEAAIYEDGDFNYHVASFQYDLQILPYGQYYSQQDGEYLQWFYVMKDFPFTGKLMHNSC